MPDGDIDLSALLHAWRNGDENAAGQLVPIVEKQLRRIAKARLGRSSPDPALTTTVLLQETYLRLLGGPKVDWQDRAHFFALCSKIMRDILVDHARARASSKRAGAHVPLAEDLVLSPTRSEELLAIDEALRSMAEIDPRKARVVELRFFGGMTVEETAEALHISPETVNRDWRLAKLWLLRRIKGGSTDGVSDLAKGRANP
jgi:RNA polymerase sigma factor (TIGR02999 family)